MTIPSVCFSDGMTSLETTLSSIVFEELLHKGTFKVVHKALVGTAEVVVKRLRGMPLYVTMKLCDSQQASIRSVFFAWVK